MKTSLRESTVETAGDVSSYAAGRMSVLSQWPNIRRLRTGSPRRRRSQWTLRLADRILLPEEPGIYQEPEWLREPHFCPPPSLWVRQWWVGGTKQWARL